MMQAPIEFNGNLKPRPYTRRIVIHHSDSAPETTVEQIHQWHLARGWAGIGYHYVVRGDGTVWRGRPEDTQGAHAYDSATRQANSDGIGICVCGKFEVYTPTEAQLQALAELIKDIWTRHPGIQVIGHRDVCATACPGKLFPWADLLRRLDEPDQIDIIRLAKDNHLIVGDHNPDEVADKRFVLTVGLNLINEIGGK